MTAYASHWLEHYERDALVYGARARVCFERYQKTGDRHEHVCGMSFMRASLRASVAAHRIRLRESLIVRTPPQYLTVRVRVV